MEPIVAKPLNTEIFKERASTKHGCFYNYDMVEYKGAHELVKIKCPVHGIFEQKAYAHLNGQGCINCFNESDKHTGNKHRKSKSLLLEQFKEKHGDRFDYSMMEYKSTNEKIKIRCIKHNEIFEQVAKSHLNGYVGCQQCVAEDLSLKYKKESFNKFVNKAIEKYGDYYTYEFDDFVYRNNITFNCKLHGQFSCTHRLFLNVQGCPTCHPKPYKDLIAYTKTHYVTICGEGGSNLYLIRLFNDNESFYKIGITNDIQRRIKLIGTTYNVEPIHVIHSKDAGLVWSSERKLHKWFKEKSYSPLINFKGENECFAFDTVDECINLMNELMKDE